MTNKVFEDFYAAKISSIDNTIVGTREDDMFDINLQQVPNSLVELGRGNDYFSVNNGEHIINGERGNDTISSGDGADLLNGGRGDDHLSGDAGNDTLFGGRGNDMLEGGNADDLLVGERGNDILAGNEGIDMLHGGRGDDIFVHEAGDGTTIIKDFEKGQDKILLAFDGVSSLEDVLAVAQDIIVTDDSLTVVVDANNTLVVQGDTNVEGSDFMFA